MKFFSLLVVLLWVSGCATSSDSVQSRVATGQSSPPGGSPAASNAPPAPSRWIESLGRFAHALRTAVSRDGPSTVPAETGSAAAAPPELGRAQPLPPQRARPLPPIEAGSTRRNGPERASGAAAGNAAVAYEAAMLKRDAPAMARAAARLTRRAITEDSIRALNAQLGIEADEEVVAAVVRFGRR